jgi:type VI secretion system protein ImpE
MPMTADELYRAGRVDAAVELLGAELRDNPTDLRRRTFLFELLCFNGKYDRAERQLEVLAQGGRDAELGTLLYRSALHAERQRQSMFETRAFPTGPAPRAVSGTLNGQPFESLTDADPRIGARLELFAGGSYTWLPFEHIASVQLQAPQRLRDLLWSPALVRAADHYRQLQLGEVLVPVLAPLTWQQNDESLRLGRVTQWEALDDGAQVPVGQKMLLVDDEEFPLLEVRELVITPTPVAEA